MVVERVAGDGFEEFFREVYPRARQVAYRILGNRQEAEDAAADAFARALASWRRVKGLSYREAWVLRVTANVAIDVTRRRKRAANRPPEPPVPADEPGADRLALLQLLERLPRRQRDVLVLRYLTDLTDVQVAECLSLSLGTVKTHAHRGLSGLRELLSDTPREALYAVD
jgi:RNA polymerase sigma-70 factor (ECF subfamily)